VPTTVRNLYPSAHPAHTPAAVCLAVSHSVNQMFLSAPYVPSSTTHTHSPMLVALLAESDARTEQQKVLDLQRAAADVWLRREGYVAPKNIFEAWNRPWPEGELYRTDSDKEVAYIEDNGVATVVDRSTIPGINVLTCHWVCGLNLVTACYHA